MPKAKPTILVCTGHTKREKGARNKQYGYTEWGLMTIFVSVFTDILTNNLVTFDWLSDSLLTDKVRICNQNDYNLALDFHMNAFNTHAEGHLCLYWHTSKKGVHYAQAISNAISCNKQRYNIAIDKLSRKGGYFLKKTKCPAVIVEVGFIDNMTDVIRTMYSPFQVCTDIFNGIMLAYEYLEIPEETHNQSV